MHLLLLYCSTTKLISVQDCCLELFFYCDLHFGMFQYRSVKQIGNRMLIMCNHYYLQTKTHAQNFPPMMERISSHKFFIKCKWANMWLPAAQTHYAPNNRELQMLIEHLKFMAKCIYLGSCCIIDRILFLIFFFLLLERETKTMSQRTHKSQLQFHKRFDNRWDNSFQKPH